MIGNKKLAQIRDELTQELVRSGLELLEWYEEHLQMLNAKSQPNASDLESLGLIRDALESLRQPMRSFDA